MPIIPEGLISTFIQFIVLLWATLQTNHFDLAYTNALLADEQCRVNVKLHQVYLWADMGDGLFDGKMEVKLFFELSDGIILQQRAYPDGSFQKAEKGDRFRLEDYTFSTFAADEIELRFLALEIDELPRISGIDIGQALRVAGSSAQADFGFVGGIIDNILQGSADSLSNLFAKNEIIAEETIVLARSANWNAGQAQLYRSENGHIELLYTVSTSGCE